MRYWTMADLPGINLYPLQLSLWQEAVSERLGPVPADLQAWAKRASVVTAVRRREERWGGREGGQEEECRRREERHSR